MKYLLATILFLSFSTYQHAQIIESRNSIIEGFISGCKKHKDTQIIIEKFGKNKGEIIIDSYCKCRANFMVNNLNFRQLELIYIGKEKMNSALFQKMEHVCTKQLDELLR